MKKIYLSIALGAAFITTQAQDRVFWSVACPTFSRTVQSSRSMAATASSSVANPSANTTGWFQGTGDPVTGSITPASTSYNSAAIKPEYGIAVSPSGFLYGVAGSFNRSTNNGLIQLAYKPATSLDNTPPSTTIAVDLNGSSNTAILPMALGISVSGKGGFIYFDGNVLKYAGFTANASGSVTWGAPVNITFSNTDNPTAWSSDFDVSDLVFDDAGNLYILAERYNADYTVMENVIYTAPSASLVSGAIAAPLRWIISDSKSLTNGKVTGLGYASGNFYISQSETADFSTFTNYITAVQPPAGGTSLTLGNNYTALSGYCELNDLAVIPEFALPADWGAVNAFIQNGQLTVQWQTLKETNNSHFEVEVSTDGITFSGIGKVDSKAINGNNDTLLNYDFKVDANGVALGFSAVALLMIFIRRRKTFLALTAALALTAIVQVGCSKNSNEVVAADASLFVRIAQVDKDGAKTYSRVIQVNNKH